MTGVAVSPYDAAAVSHQDGETTGRLPDGCDPGSDCAAGLDSGHGAGSSEHHHAREAAKAPEAPARPITLSQELAPRILVVDDEKSIREILTDFLELEGYVVDAVADGESALVELSRRTYDIVLSDLKMPGIGGLDLLEAITHGSNPVLVVIMTGFGTVETAIEAMKRGAYDYVLKPFKIEDVVRVLRRGLDRQLLAQENLRLREALSIYRISEAIATSMKLDHILELIVQATLEEVEADLVTLLLEDPATGQMVERLRKHAAHAAPGTKDGSRDFGHGRLEAGSLLAHFRGDLPLLAHGPRALRFFAGAGHSDEHVVSFCSVPLRIGTRVFGALNACSYTPGRRFTEGQRKMLSVLASRVAVSIENAQLYGDLVDRNRELGQASASLEENFTTTLIGFAHALEEADRYTRGHSERVSFYSSLLAEGLEMPLAEQRMVVQAGLMHDIGKIGIRYDKLNKPGKLTPEETAMFRTHPAKGKRILEPMRFMAELIPAAWCHHEHFDGAGYPQGLAGDAIPLVGRVVSIADTYDAMTSDRAYRKALPHEVAVRELVRCAGTQFDPELVQVFTRRIEENRVQRRAAGEWVPR